jgi:Raf kinase inhibitor-like YbhB/YbcL family protein
MKRRTTILLVALLLPVMAVLSIALHAFTARNADANYHLGLESRQTLVVTSQNLNKNADIPVAFTCRGSGKSPQIEWAGAPGNAMSFVLLVVDWDVPSPNLPLSSFTHWALYNIPKGTTVIGEAATATQIRTMNIDIAENSEGTHDYAPPCPPLGKHRYRFRIYALDIAHLQPQGSNRKAILAAMKGHIMAFGELVRTFGS